MREHAVAWAEVDDAIDAVEGRGDAVQDLLPEVRAGVVEEDRLEGVQGTIPDGLAPLADGLVIAVQIIVIAICISTPNCNAS